MRQDLLDKIIEVAAELHAADTDDLEELLSHVQEEGTDHQDGSPVDSMTEALLQAAVDEK